MARGPAPTPARPLSATVALVAAIAAAALAIATVAAQSPAPPAQVWISEVSPAGRADREWFELANGGAEPVTLQGWRIADKTDSDPLPLITIPPGGTVIIAAADAHDFQTDHAISDGRIGGGLNDDGDRLSLFNQQEQERDAIAWERIAAPSSLQRRTPDAEPCISAPNPGRIPTSRPHRLRITEIMPNPAAGPEWVELSNSDSTTVDLHGWTLGDEHSSTPLSGRIAANSRLIVANAELSARESPTLLVPAIGNGLNNDRDAVQLVAPGCIPADSVAYGTPSLPAPAQGSSIALQQRWLINVEPSPGADGITSALAGTPIAAAEPSETAPPAQTPDDAPGIDPWMVVSASLAALIAAIALRQWRTKPDDAETRPASPDATLAEDLGLDQPPLDQPLLDRPPAEQPDIRYDDPGEPEPPLASVADSGETEYVAHSSPEPRRRHPWDDSDQ